MNHHRTSHGFGALAFVAAVAFAFGIPAARVLVGAVLVAGGLFFAYVMVRVIMGTI